VDQVVIDDKKFGVAKRIRDPIDVDPPLEDVFKNVVGGPGYYRDVAVFWKKEFHFHSTQSGSMQGSEDFSGGEKVWRHDAHPRSGDAENGGPKFQKDVVVLVRAGDDGPAEAVSGHVWDSLEQSKVLLGGEEPIIGKGVP